MIYERDYMRDDRGRYGAQKASFWERSSAVKILLIVNSVIWLLCNFPNGNNLVQFLGLNISAVRGVQIWRFVTYMFTHQSFSHILFNMWGLYVFGGLVEGILGKSRFIQLYVFSGLIGGGLYLAVNWGAFSALSEALRLMGMAQSSLPVCIGASGSVFGVMTAAAMAFPNARMRMIIPPIELKLRTMALAFFIIEVVLELSIHDNVAHIAHLGGMLGAFIFMRRLFPAMRMRYRGGTDKPWWRSAWERLTNLFGSSASGSSSRMSSMGRGPGDKRLGDISPNEVDRILDKLSTSGRDSLTPHEQEVLKEASLRLRDSRPDE